MEDNYKDERVVHYPPISLFEWMLTLLVLTIPVLNLIMLVIWAFGTGQNPTRVNFARAVLLWMLIGFILGILFFSTIIGTLSQFSDMVSV